MKQCIMFTDFKRPCDSVRKDVIYNNLIEFGKPIQVLQLIKMNLCEKYSRVRVGKYLSDVFPITNVLKLGDNVGYSF
jgi:hypothetical protein